MIQKQQKIISCSIIGAILLLLIFLAVVSFKPPAANAEGPKYFKDYAHLKKYIQANTKIAEVLNLPQYVSSPMTAFDAQNKTLEKAVPAPSVGKETDFSTTNIQVAGVDEADIIKNDGKYLYTITGNSVVIVNAYPPTEAEKLSQLNFSNKPEGLFVKNNDIVVFVHTEQGLGVYLYDVSDRKNPNLKKKFTIEESFYVSSRLIGDYVYLIVNTPVKAKDGFNGLYRNDSEDLVLPEIIEENGVVSTISANKIQYFDLPSPDYQYTMIVALNLKNQTRKTETYLTGSSQSIFVSENNIYLTSLNTGNILPLFEKHGNTIADYLPLKVRSSIKKIIHSDMSFEEKFSQINQITDNFFSSENNTIYEGKTKKAAQSFYKDVFRTLDNTLVQKFNVSATSVKYAGQVNVPGKVLNQFSMDEYKKCFRIATTNQEFIVDTWGGPSESNVFIYDENLKNTGKLTGIAPGERIYSARFMGDKVYLVTFRETDPFFVIDLKNSTKPKILGYLKIPGFSNYLHPYDENHIIGIGKERSFEEPRLMEGSVEVAPAQLKTEENFDRVSIPRPPRRQDTLKISLFDVTNPETPKEIFKYIIDKDYSDSEALRDHKAFLFSKAKNIIAIPVTCPESMDIQYRNNTSVPYNWQWQGSYVFNISLEKGIVLKGRIDHTGPFKSDRQYGSAVRRILFIDDVLYTVSDDMVKMNKISDMSAIGSIYLN